MKTAEYRFDKTVRTEDGDELQQWQQSSGGNEFPPKLIEGRDDSLKDQIRYYSQSRGGVVSSKADIEIQKQDREGTKFLVISIMPRATFGVDL